MLNDSIKIDEGDGHCHEHNKPTKALALLLNFKLVYERKNRLGYKAI